MFPVSDSINPADPLCLSRGTKCFTWPQLPRTSCQVLPFSANPSHSSHLPLATLSCSYPPRFISHRLGDPITAYPALSLITPASTAISHFTLRYLHVPDRPTWFRGFAYTVDSICMDWRQRARGILIHQTAVSKLDIRPRMAAMEMGALRSDDEGRFLRDCDFDLTLMALSSSLTGKVGMIDTTVVMTRPYS